MHSSPLPAQINGAVEKLKRPSQKTRTGGTCCADKKRPRRSPAKNRYCDGTIGRADGYNRRRDQWSHHSIGFWPDCGGVVFYQRNMSRQYAFFVMDVSISPPHH